MDDRVMVLVTGAAGKTGKAVIGALAARGMGVRAFVRRPAQAEEVTALGAQEVHVGDMRDLVMFSRAAQGVQAIYHICPNVSPDEVDIGRNAIEAAITARASRFVYHSVLHPHVEAMPHHWRKMRVEELLFSSGLDFTILQPAAYMQNVLAGWRSIAEEGLYKVPYPLETRLGMVDLLDVAEAAAVVLDDPVHVGAIYELAGPDNLTQREVALILERLLGRPVRVEQISLAAWRERAVAAGLAAYQVESLEKMFLYYERYGFGGSSFVLSRLLKRPATTFDEFVRRVLGERPG